MGYEITIGFFFGVLLIMNQRIVERHRATFRRFIYFLVFLLFMGGQPIRANLFGLGIAIVVSYLFWLLIGRYNPVLNDEEVIKVYGIDD